MGASIHCHIERKISGKWVLIKPNGKDWRDGIYRGSDFFARVGCVRCESHESPLNKPAIGWPDDISNELKEYLSDEYDYFNHSHMSLREFLEIFADVSGEKMQDFPWSLSKIFDENEYRILYCFLC